MERNTRQARESALEESFSLLVVVATLGVLCIQAALGSPELAARTALAFAAGLGIGYAAASWRAGA